MILSFFALEMHYFLMIFVLFTHILPPYKEGNGNLISGEKRVPLFMLSHIAQKGDFGAFKRRKTIVFGDPLFFFRPASAKFYEEFFLPTYLLILFFLFFVSFRKFFFSHLIFDCLSVSCGFSEISVISKGYRQHFSALGQYGRA